MAFYLTTLGVYFGIDLLSAWSLNLQYSYAGIINFGWILFQSIGAYTAAITSIGAPSPRGAQQYLFGADLPFPIPLLLAAGAGGVLSLVVGLVILRKIRPDYQAAVLIMLTVLAIQIVTNVIGLFNGGNGLTGIPKPLASWLDLSETSYNTVYMVWVLFLCILGYLVVERLCRSSWGRSLRALRDNETALEAIGIGTSRLRMEAFVVGGVIAGLTGGLLVEFIGAWTPAAWSYAETFSVFTIILIGGRGNNRGMIIGTLLVPVLFLEAPTFLPQFGYTGLIDSLEWVLVGILYLVTLAFRPQGILPERRNRAVRLTTDNTSIAPDVSAQVSTTTSQSTVALEDR